jgi:hydrogenase maturation factor HypF (carbamoyltransferase family)
MPSNNDHHHRHELSSIKPQQQSGVKMKTKKKNKGSDVGKTQTREGGAIMLLTTTKILHIAHLTPLLLC